MLHTDLWEVAHEMPLVFAQVDQHLPIDHTLMHGQQWQYGSG